MDARSCQERDCRARPVERRINNTGPSTINDNFLENQNRIGGCRGAQRSMSRYRHAAGYHGTKRRERLLGMLDPGCDFSWAASPWSAPAIQGRNISVESLRIDLAVL